MYFERDTKMPLDHWHANLYHPRHPVGLLFHEHNHSILINALNSLGINLTSMRILDVGCGLGYWLRYLVELGASPGYLIGVDLSIERIIKAKLKNSSINLIHGSGSALPFKPDSFDMVMQVLVFSSIHEKSIWNKFANEMVRSVKQGGYIFWLDLIRTSSSNLVTFSKQDIITCFPGMKIIYKKKVQPFYFRVLYKYPWLVELLYNFTKLGCESQLIILRKKTVDEQTF